MNFAVIAAGDGSRLTQEGLNTPKPLVNINGTPMIKRLFDIFMNVGAEKIVVINNEWQTDTQQFIRHLKNQGLPVQLVVKNTPSSMHSFYHIMTNIGKGKFCLTTVDTIFKQEEFGKFIQEFKNDDCDGYMAVTDYIDDEKPLYVSYDKQGWITGFHDSVREFQNSKAGRDGISKCDCISGGIYCLDDRAFNTLEKCFENGIHRMRNFQRQLIEDGFRLKAYKFNKILDIDHVEDIKKAEIFLK